MLTRVDIFKDGNVPILMEVRDAISSDKQPKVGASVKPGTAVGLRLDIPAFERTLSKPIRKDGKPTFIVAVHEKWDGAAAGRAGTPICYLPKARITGPLRFMVNERAAQAIMGPKPKSTIATVEGQWAKDQSVPAGIETWTQAPPRSSPLSCGGHRRADPQGGSPHWCFGYRLTMAGGGRTPRPARGGVAWQSSRIPASQDAATLREWRAGRGFHGNPTARTPHPC